MSQSIEEQVRELRRELEHSQETSRIRARANSTLYQRWLDLGVELVELRIRNDEQRKTIAELKRDNQDKVKTIVGLVSDDATCANPRYYSEKQYRELMDRNQSLEKSLASAEEDVRIRDMRIQKTRSLRIAAMEYSGWVRS